MNAKLINKKLKSSLFLAIFLFIAISSAAFLMSETNKFEKEISHIFLAQIPSVNLNEKSVSIVTLVFVGDIMLDRGVEYSIRKYGNNNWHFPFFKIADYLREADILFGNLEGPISDKGQKVGSIYSFRADPEVIDGLVFAGFDILSVANNHIFDYGREAMEDNFSRLEAAGIYYLGGGFNETEAYSPKVIEINGTKIALLAYTNLGSPYWVAKENKSGIAWLEKERLVEDIKNAKDKADLLFVSMHFGEEYQSLSNAEQKLFARLSIDTGADLVIGHHPHVIQEIEEYKNGHIAYSLGNFIFDQGFSEKTMKGLLLKVLIENGKIKELTPTEIKINEFFQPEISK